MRTSWFFAALAGLSSGREAGMGGLSSRRIRLKPRLSLLVAAALVALFAPNAHAGLTLAGQITAGDFSQTGGLDTTSTSTTCATPTATPPPTGGTYNYDRYGFMNIDSVPHCFTVSVTSSGDVQPVVYSRAYSPSNPQTGYLGDSGACTNLGAGNTVSFSVTVPPGGFYVIVSDCISGSFGTPSYTLAVNFDTLFDDMAVQPTATKRVLSLNGPSTCGTPTPTPSELPNDGVNYDAYTIVNTSGAAECVIAVLRGIGQYGGVLAHAYLGSFDPGNQQTNFIGESGSENCFDYGSSPASFSFEVPAGGQSVLVVESCATSIVPMRDLPILRVDIGITGPPTAVTLRSIEAARTPRGVLVRWRTAAESRTFGFNVYRWRSGRWLRVNRRLVPAAFAGTTRGCPYSWLDRRAPAGPVRYRLQAVGLDGTRSWIGSTIRA